MRNPKTIEMWEKAGYSDNFVFRMTMDKEELCKDLLECLLEIKIDSLTVREYEKSIETEKRSKGIRLDLYIKDSNGTTYDIEIQTGNHHDLGKRARYYRSIMDGELLQKGESYSKLGKTIIIFICTFDPYTEGMSRYIFKNTCVNSKRKGLEMGDEATCIFFNSAGDRDGLTEAQQHFLDYVAGNGAHDEFTRKLEERVQEIKMDREKRVEYMTWQQEIIEQRAEEREIAFAEGIVQGREYITQMNLWLIQNGRHKDLEASFTDNNLQCQLLDEYQRTLH